MILAIDTTHEFGSIALFDRGEILEEELLHAPDGFGHILYGNLLAVLERHGLRVQDIDCFAAASGPGSFTGVRVGLACVKGALNPRTHNAERVTDGTDVFTTDDAPIPGLTMEGT